MACGLQPSRGGLKGPVRAVLALVLALALTVTTLGRPGAVAVETGGETARQLALTQLRESIAVPSTGLVPLDGHSLTVPAIIDVAREGSQVAIDPGAMARVQQSYDLLLAAAAQDIPVYGLNRGVGENKDKTIFSGEIDPEARRASERFNANNLRATSAGVGPEAAEEVVRAAMVIRLNTILVGYTGAQPQLAERYRDFLNLRIHPVMPTRASVGEADITILSHIGLAMMGEGEVNFAGRRMPAAQALREAGLAPLVPFGKDSLVIMSSNAYAAALAALVVHDTEHVLAVARKVGALSLEGLNGNVAPFLPPVHAIRPYTAQGRVAAGLLAELDGSYLWQTSAQRALQDPLSFRTMSHVLGVAEDRVGELKELLAIQLNSSDDNPASIPGIAPPPGAPEQIRSYYVTSGRVHGAVIPTANFEPLPWVVSLEALGIAMSHVSRTAAARITRLGTAEFTHLSRFLSPDETTLAFSAVQKVYAALDGENQELNNPVSTSPLPVAGDIEDTATNSTSAATRVLQMIDNLYYITGLELMHATQAVDLRRKTTPALALGRGTGALLQSYREFVPFLDRDRALTPDIQTSYLFLKQLPGEGA
jgi:histidine ammonia-lyase